MKLKERKEEETRKERKEEEEKLRNAEEKREEKDNDYKTFILGRIDKAINPLPGPLRQQFIYLFLHLFIVLYSLNQISRGLL